MPKEVPTRALPERSVKQMAASPRTSSQTRTQRPQVDAEVVVAVVEGVADLEGDLLVLVVEGGFQLHSQEADGVLELATLVLGTCDAAVVDGDVAEADVGGAADVDAVTGEAAVGVLGDEHLHDGAAELVDVIGLAADFHAVLDREGAGGGKAAPALDGDDAHAAGGKGLHAGVVAEVGDVDAGLDGGFQHHLAGLGGDVYSVNGDGDVVWHYFSTSKALTRNAR